jgi:hypothetical protein
MSLHVVPSVLAGFEQTPVVALQVPALWHWSIAVHVTGVPTQAPEAVQVSLIVHGLPSLHEPVRTGFEHLPVAASQVPAEWHWSEALHTTGVPGVQTPL